VRDRTLATHGNAIGIGMADFTTTRLVNAIDRDYMYTNALTSLGLQSAKIPLYFDTDREVIKHAIGSLAMVSPEDLRIVRIKNTLTLDHMLVSKRLISDVDPNLPISISTRPESLDFDASGNLTSLDLHEQVKTNAQWPS
jgi:hypothetical protein